MSNADMLQKKKPGIVIHRESDGYHVDLADNVPLFVANLPASGAGSERREPPITIETSDVRAAHSLYGPVHFIVHELERRLDGSEEGA